MTVENTPLPEEKENIVRSGINYSPNKHLKPCTMYQRETNKTCFEYSECFEDEWEDGCWSSHSLRDGAHYLSIIKPENVIKNRCYFLVTKHPNQKLHFSGLIFISDVKSNERHSYILGEPIPFEPKIVKWEGHFRGEKFIKNSDAILILKDYYSNIKDEKVKQIIDFYEMGKLPEFAGKTYWHPSDVEAENETDEEYIIEEDEIIEGIMIDVANISYLLENNPNVILYGPPGTGKTYLANKVKEEYEKRFGFITFHQSYSYEDFIEGIKPKTNEEGEKKDIFYEVENGLFKRLCERAIKNAIKRSTLLSKDILNSKQKFFKDFFKEYQKLNKDEKKNLFEDADKFMLIIDEINRGNISKIFGELITLIEKDKRLGEETEIIATLPYSKEKFGIPPNVLILGTMNTADRSIALLDVALRRRFDFYLMQPKAELASEVEGISLEKVLDSINNKIIELYDRDHQIGHSYFIGIKDMDELKYVWFYRIIPLLQEYFYNDHEKIEEIIGKVFTNEDIEMDDDDFMKALNAIIR